MPPRCTLASYTSRLGRRRGGCGDLWKEEGGGESPALAPPLPRLGEVTPWKAGGPGRWRVGDSRPQDPSGLGRGPLRSSHDWPDKPHPLAPSRPMQGISGSTRYRFHPPTTKVPFKFQNSAFLPDRDLGRKLLPFEPQFPFLRVNSNNSSPSWA